MENACIVENRKALSSVLALILAVLVVGGGSNCSARAPERVFYEFQVACMKQDRDRAKTFCTARFIEESLPPEHQMGGMVSGFTQIPAPDEYIPSFRKFSESLDTSIAGNTARVTWSLPLGDKVVYVLVMEVGGWKIDRTEP